MKGERDFNRNLSNALGNQRAGALKGMRLAVAMLKAESQDRVPVKTGNLKGGHYFRTESNRSGVIGEVGLKAEYAIYVHEILDNVHPVGEAKFLENALEEKKGEMIKIIAHYTKA